LDSLGFPWILSSETRLINTLHGRKRGNFFLSPFPWRSKRHNGRLWSLHAEAQDCSWGQLNLISNFPQHVVAEPLPFRKRVYLFEKGQRARPLLPSASAVSARST
jgi:hypothetical protein